MTTHREITECCPHCGDENTWENAPIDQKWGICETCGKLVNFCDECMYNNDGRCEPLNKNAYCYEHYVKEPIGFKAYP